jgi:hypothetical protein
MFSNVGWVPSATVRILSAMVTIAFLLCPARGGLLAQASTFQVSSGQPWVDTPSTQRTAATTARRSWPQ